MKKHKPIDLVDWSEVKKRLNDGESVRSVKNAYPDVKISTFRFEAAKRGLVYDARVSKEKPVLESIVEVGDGFTIKGTSTLLNADGEVKIQWVKTDRDKDQQYQMMVDAMEELAISIEPMRLISEPVTNNSELLTQYIVTDMHLGQLAHHTEAGKDVDSQTVYDNTLKGLQILMQQTPKSDMCIISDLGDLLHSSNDANRTKSGHELDVDSRHSKIFTMLVKLKIAMIELALQKHKSVMYIGVQGNHSDLVSIYLKAVLAAKFENNPRFSVSHDHHVHQYYRWGKVLLGFTHGHTGASAKLPSVMVADNMKIISETQYRYMHCGHYHSKTVISDNLATVEHHANLTNNDAWGHGAGFRGNKNMTAITYNKNYGESSRNIVSIEEIEDEGVV